MQSKRRPASIICIACLLLLAWVGSGVAGSENNTGQSFSDELIEGFDTRINLVGFGIYRKVEDSAVNRGNIFLIPRYQMEADLRPDFYLNFRRLDLIFKPRFELRRLWWEDGILKGSADTEDDVYVNEWLVRLRLSDMLFASYGRENLQWGPSYLLSPSNPFNRHNGRNNPELELPGQDFARLVWIPNARWTASFIANLGEGALDTDIDFSRQHEYFTNDVTQEKLDLLQELIDTYGIDLGSDQRPFGRDFENSYAFKIDYSANGKFFGFIPSVREGDDPRLGYFGGWNATNALLLYAEGSFATNSSGGSDVLVGGAYTLEMGANIAVEYFYQEDGCTAEPLAECFGTGALNRTIIPGEAYIRKNYGLLQYVDTGILNRIDLTLRLIYGFDDNSSQGIGIFQYEMNDHSRLFFIGNLLSGDNDTEYGSFLDYYLMAGAGFTF